jgi:hypothetical protein
LRRFIAVAVAVGALTSVAATSAQASPPTWFSCQKALRVERVYTGAYENSGCSVANAEHHGKYELDEGIGTKDKVSGKGGQAPGVVHTELELETSAPASSLSWGCLTARETGLMAAPNRIVGAMLTLQHCGITGPGQKTGNVVLGPMSGELEYLDGEHVGVGLDMTSEAEPGGELAEFTDRRTGATFVLRGSMIASQTGDLSAIDKVFRDRLEVSSWLGETEPGYSPRTDLPSFFEGPQDILTIEQTSGEEELPPGEHPAGLQLEMKFKGPAVQAKRS